MGSSSLFLFFSSALLPYLCLSGPITIQTIKQPFTASHFQYIDQFGVFLISSNGNFIASISNLEENSPYYFCITHVMSDAIIWIANRNHPISDSDKLYLTSNGLAINITANSSNTSVAWSTQGLNSSSQVSAMQLQDSRNLSDGDYRLVVTDGDAVLQWNRMSYWKLSAEPTGFDGKFRVSKFVDKNWVQEFVSPDDECKIPLICNKMGLCTSGRCSCPPNFHGDPLSKSGCTPTDASLALPSGCIDRKESNSSVFYVNLGSELDYFANGFMDPAIRDISLLACQDLCTRNCSCLGIFYGNSSACYLLENPLGSIMGSSSSDRKRLGYVKTIVVSSNANKLNEAIGFPIVGLILLPSSGVLLIIIVVLGFICWRRNRLYRTAKSKLGRGDSSSSELEIISSRSRNFTERHSLDKSVVAVKKITNVGWELRQAYFPLHALEMHEKKRYSELTDSRLEGRVMNEEVGKLVKVALCCLHEDPILRPTMVTVVSMLEGISPLTEPRQESLNFLRFYGRRFNEASRIEFGFSSSDKLMSCMSAQQLSSPR
ncbi:S-LOCUS RECEPTOR KINASE (SRK) [Salix koriyanagi]|uniref:S-LOCUS RECEPTOR KINASE (SRK) n=1 Tax=Salix koriyanagi TaxID=2511006 RepID=A0A9Q0W6I2_9ROSI|nr:S-LOCUS RECEPTOR KINASE (SRK) [Salix koriyanagi]